MIKGVLLDLGGVVFVGDGPIPGAIAAVGALKARGLPVRFITNTTRQSLAELLGKLYRLGLDATADELFVPSVAARRLLVASNLKARLLIHPNLRPDFEGVAAGNDAVVVGDAADGFTYAALNGAFRALDGGAMFLALARNRSFRDSDGQLSLDAGPFVAALAYAAGRDATVLGKPSEAFFAAALASLGCSPAEAVMIGDDVEADVGAAMAVGIAGVLVQTGKYVPGDEAKVSPPPTAVAADLAAAVAWVVAQADG